ncbi:MAG: phosphoenolpyruvate synthase [Peptococcaceae bacterium BICA1-7]|nr:MAG: phosphoenolpyruvate synthase [Peptococcaceae bacterium BICA1-7]
MQFDEIDRASLPDVGGKGANLGEMARAGFPVPQGFCITTFAYRKFISASHQMDELLGLLDRLRPDQLDQISNLGKRIRDHLQSVTIPQEIKAAVIDGWKKSGEEQEYAVRSSATAEDLPTASFAGQQETYLNIKGADQLLQAVQQCWTSLFTDRAIVYRAKNRFDHRSVFLSVVVQRMVFPEVAGIMFTADPVTGNRKIVAIDASFGLGEALVSGIVSADLYQVKEDKLVKKKIARKEMAIYARPEGGTAKVEIKGEQQTAPALSDHQAVRLARIGRSIEEHFGSPQDIEWGLYDDQIFILQSRPITTLYPVPATADDKLHLFLSFGHAQMMTEVIKPLGLSVIRTVVPFGKRTPRAESYLMLEAGGRLYLDITHLLEYPQLRKRLPGMLANVDELMGRVVQDFVGREEFQAAPQHGKKLDLALVKKAFPTAFAILRNILYRENYQAIEEMNRFIADKVRESNKRLQEVSGPDRITQIQEMLSTLLPIIFSTVVQYMGAAIITYKLIESLSQKWLGDAAQLGEISKSPPGNVTTEMGLALGDVADAIRNHPAVIEYLSKAADHTFFEDLRGIPGGEDVMPVLSAFFDRYGMRGTGEIDVTRPRWREAPTQLVPAILSHIKGVEPGRHRLDFLAGREAADLAAERLLDRLRKTPRGSFKARRMQRLIKVHRLLIGIREHPKYFIVQNLDLIKKAILQEADKLVAAGVLAHREDIYWFSLQEIKEIINIQQVDPGTIASRKEKFQYDLKLTPPRALTSEGEIITAKPGAQVPPGALPGSPVSAGTAVGRARVILKLEEAKMDKGDILVAPYTDPGWTPLFSLAAGLVTEVGGLMTHGAVVAREYGIPAVVAVDHATKILKDGQYIRVDGTKGFIEVLGDTMT